MYSFPSFLSLTHTGQVIIPVGARGFGITVVSGQATVGGITYPQGLVQNWTSPDAKVVLGTSIAVGATGVGNKTNVFYSN